jgi:hypothetical protein
MNFDHVLAKALIWIFGFVWLSNLQGAAMKSRLVYFLTLLLVTLPATVHSSDTIVWSAETAAPSLPEGTVIDSATGLMWMRCSLGQTWVNSTCTGKAT